MSFSKALFGGGIALASIPGSSFAAEEPLHLQPGYVYRLRCDGRLLISAVGSEHVLRLEALPKELGCGAILKPLQASGRSNIILETSTGTIVRTVEISQRSVHPKLEIFLSSRGAK
jgi:hypothetical protein